MEWETLAFFIGLFVMVGALVNIGVIDWLAEQAVDAVGGRFLLAATVLLFGSAGFSLGMCALPVTPKVLLALMFRSNMNPS